MIENVIQIKSGMMANVDARIKTQKTLCVQKIWNLATCNCENGKYLASIIYNSVITCDEIVEETKTIPTNFDKKITCKTKKLYNLLTFLLITIALLIAVSIYCLPDKT